MRFKFPVLLLLAGLLLAVTNVSSKKYRYKYKATTPVFMQSTDSWAQQKLNGMTLEEKIAQFFMVSSWPNRDEEHQQEIENLVKNNKVGGIIYFQGTKDQLKTSIARMQKASKTPLLIGMDAEWGLAMRLSGEERFPYAYTLGTANDTVLSEKIGAMMAQESRQLGVHLNFAPVADVNSNPANPVIGFRSFGQDPELVGKHVKAMVKGIEKNGVLTSIKHFPGHGDTDTDSHYELPNLSHDKNHFNSIEFKPFLEGLNAGASTVMIGHLSVPALDESQTPASLSKPIIQGFLQQEMGFKGLVVSDALNMKAVADKYGKVDVAVKAFLAGHDILLCPENVHDAIQAIAEKVKAGEISETEINERCLKILKAKAHVTRFKGGKTFTTGQQEWARRETYEKAMTVVENKNTLPLVNASSRIAVVSIGVNAGHFKNMADRFHPVDYFHFYSFEEAAERMKNKFAGYETVITTIHPKSVLASSDFSSPGKAESWIAAVPGELSHVAVLFGNPMLLKNTDIAGSFDACVLAYENHKFAQEEAAQLVFGATGASAKLQFSVSENLPIGSGLALEDAKRLKFSQPEELGILPEDLAKIDAIVNKGLNAGAYPGCQVLVAVEGKIIYSKNFGKVSYEDTTPVNSNHVYDVASVSKIVGSTAALMRLQSEGKFSLDKYLKDYIPELVGNSPVGNIYIKNMMAHQAGFTPWIAFYKSTVNHGSLDKNIYSEVRKDGFEIPVASNLWIRSDYEKTIYKTILNTPLTRNPKYEYSDLGYYFAKKIIEKESGFPLDQFMYREYYDPMGLRNIRYLPLLHFPKERIVPTELDTAFRGRLVHGFVHDPGAAMLGGVGGHAGVFSNSTDLAAMMQLFLNKGVYANRRYISADIVKQYTSAQLKGNRRGAGFDRPTNSRKDGPTCNLVSLESFGHSGFTGTFTWADPAYGINYVFLSNRVYPDASNKKIQEMHIRSDVQKVIYEAVMKAKKSRI